jgi:predicted exporter
VRKVWPTVRLGLLTSLCGFASLLPSGFPGLAQLGLYSMAGLVGAALVTRFVLPGLLPVRWVARPLTGPGRALARALDAARPYRQALWLVPLAAGAVLFIHREAIWNRDLAALSPVSAADQALDGRLRSSLGAPDVRDLIVVSAPDTQRTLEAAEAVSRRLEPLVAAGELAGFETPTRYLPSLALQNARRAALPDRAELERRLAPALAGLPVRQATLAPFVDAVEGARTGPSLEPAALEGTSLAAGFHALLTERGGRTVALLPLAAPAGGPHPLSIDIEAVRHAVGESPGDSSVLVIDLKHESDALYSTYLGEALRLSAFGFAAIVLLLLIALRSVRRTLRVVAPLVLAVLVVIAGLVVAGRMLTILHLIGLLLIVAVGSNYALFFDRGHADAARGERETTLASLGIANLATVLGFGILALSPVPVLAALGTTVGPGALAALLFSGLMADPTPET